MDYVSFAPGDRSNSLIRSITHNIAYLSEAEMIELSLSDVENNLKA